MPFTPRQKCFVDFRAHIAVHLSRRPYERDGRDRFSLPPHPLFARDVPLPRAASDRPAARRRITTRATRATLRGTGSSNGALLRGAAHGRDGGELCLMSKARRIDVEGAADRHGVLVLSQGKRSIQARKQDTVEIPAVDSLLDFCVDELDQAEALRARAPTCRQSEGDEREIFRKERVDASVN